MEQESLGLAGVLQNTTYRGTNLLGKEDFAGRRLRLEESVALRTKDLDGLEAM
jgi:hypothetical protein